MSDDFHSPKSLLGGILSGMLQNMTSRQQAGAQMLRGWEGIVGKALAEKSRVIDLQNDCLHIAVREGGAMQLLMMKKRDILYKLRKQYAGLNVKDLYIFIEKTASQMPVVNNTQKTNTSSAQKISSKDEISDEEFRAVMQRIKSYGKQEK